MGPSVKQNKTSDFPKSRCSNSNNDIDREKRKGIKESREINDIGTDYRYKKTNQMKNIMYANGS